MPLQDDDYVAMIAPSLLHEYGARAFAPDLLLRAPLLTNPDVSCGRMVLAHLNQHLGEPRLVRSIRDDVAIARMAERGLGIGILPRLAVSTHGEALVLVPLDPPLVRTIAVAIRSDGLKVPAVRAFLSALAALYPQAGLPAAPREWTPAVAAAL